MLVIWISTDTKQTTNGREERRLVWIDIEGIEEMLGVRKRYAADVSTSHRKMCATQY